MKPSKPTFATLQVLIQDFFEKHLTIERHASRHTVLAYRDSLKLFLRYTAERAGCAADRLDCAAAAALPELTQGEFPQGDLLTWLDALGRPQRYAQQQPPLPANPLGRDRRLRITEHSP